MFVLLHNQFDRKCMLKGFIVLSALLLTIYVRFNRYGQQVWTPLNMLAFFNFLKYRFTNLSK
jgi:hypothetical protein